MSEQETAGQQQAQHDGSSTDPAADAARRASVGEDLRLAFVALGAPGMPAAERPAWHKRLIAITNSSKHDLATAERRMAAWWADYEATVGPRPTA